MAEDSETRTRKGRDAPRSSRGPSAGGFARAFRRARERLDMTIEEAAEFIGCSEGSIMNWESGESPGPREFDQAAWAGMLMWMGLGPEHRRYKVIQLQRRKPTED